MLAPPQTNQSRLLTSGRLLVAWIKWLTSGWSLTARIALGITVLIFLFQLPFFFSPGLTTAGANLLEHLYVLIWLLVVTALNRTLPLRTLAVFWFVGIYPVTALALLAAVPVAKVYGAEAPMVIAVWVPICEEVLKALPVALYLALAAGRKRWQPAATDALVLGFIVGAGYAFHEDAMALRNGGSGWVASIWSIFFPTLTSSGSIYQSSEMILGHGGWTAFVSLALGLAFFYRRYRFVWLLPISALLLVTLEHGISNFVGSLGRHSAPVPINIARTLLLHGQLSIILLLIGLVVTLILEQRILRRIAVVDRLFTNIPLRDLVSRFWPVTRANLPRLLAVRNYLRLRREAYYTLESLRGRMVDKIDLEHSAGMSAALFIAGLNAGLPLDQKIRAMRARSTTPGTGGP